ncbi:sulfide/dihydroorotate dehydrogenase-like FAD/NAD-binding protein [Clostridium sp. JN-1]|uniref:sulfide/dihydroorotate dehydrogenase-like FAD/NAD-binding protein n=1 Tax=Clostridium sp. JN-1 TaxID=2483110 RepID=UPI000F0B9802|nr:sulfide/dihydroorotate dehydrogenase-like FAD/NAD-binding protein [Clostridium sp. JN-1]
MYCIDAGSIYCPCHLAETLDCVHCSQLSGDEFCNCKDWCGVCIYEKYLSNGSTASKLRETYKCSILKKEIFQNNLCIFKLSVPQSLAKELIYPGSFVFLRTMDSLNYYDVPISVMESDIDSYTLKIVIKVNGTKTKKLFELNEGDELLLRGPFSNGIMGLLNINKAKNGTSIIAAREIGIVPSILVMKKLYSNGNKIISLIDSKSNPSVYKKYFEDCNSEIINCTILDHGNLTEEFKSTISKILDENTVNLIHCGGPDIMIYQIIKSIDKSINLSCCNNSKMGCGEGICGSCTKHYEGDIVKRLCKVQIDPRDLFKDRRAM